MRGSYKDGLVVRAVGPVDGGEIELITEREEWTHGFDPKFYTVEDGVLIPVSSDDATAIKLADEKVAAKAMITTSRLNHVNSYYPVYQRQDVALGIYPPDQENIVLLFIAACIGVEEDVCAAIDDTAADQTDIQSIIASIVWPEPGEAA